MNPGDFKIENVAEADAYLRALLNKPAYRSMAEVQKRAQDYIDDAGVRLYFIDTAREMLNARRRKADGQ